MTIRAVSDGLVMVTGTAAIYCGMWSRGRARKRSTCQLSGRPILKGDLCYRPVTNTIERQYRVLADVMERYTEAGRQALGT